MLFDNDINSAYRQTMILLYFVSIIRPIRFLFLVLSGQKSLLHGLLPFVEERRAFVLGVGYELHVVHNLVAVPVPANISPSCWGAGMGL